MKIIQFQTYNNFYPILFLVKNTKNNNKQHTSGLDIDTNGDDRENKSEDKTDLKRREDLLTKLKSLAITEDEDDFDSDSDIDIESEDNSSNNDID